MDITELLRARGDTVKLSDAVWGDALQGFIERSIDILPAAFPNVFHDSPKGFLVRVQTSWSLRRSPADPHPGIRIFLDLLEHLRRHRPDIPVQPQHLVARPSSTFQQSLSLVRCGRKRRLGSLRFAPYPGKCPPRRITAVTGGNGDTDNWLEI